MKDREAIAVRQTEAQRQQREIEREHARQIADAKIAAWRKTRKDAGPLGIESGFARAMKRAAEKEARRSASGRGKDRDLDRER